MALNSNQLEADLGSVFAVPRTAHATAAALWAAAFETYRATITPASFTPVSVTQPALEAALGTAFAAGFTDDQAAANAIEAALLTFATSIGSGMGGFVATPPILPIGLSTAFASIRDAGGSASDSAAALAGAIHAWFITGTATPTAGGSPVPWS